MARIEKWSDLGELGDAASWSLYGASFFGLGGRTGLYAEPFHDLQGNGGDYALRFQTPDAGLISPYLASPISTFYWRAHFKANSFGYSSIPSGARFLVWRMNSTELGYLWVDSTGGINLQVGSTLASTPPAVIAAGVYATVELQMTIGNSAAYELRVNGVTQFSGTGDTQPGSDTGVNNFYMIMGQAAAFTENFHWFDDVAVDDADWVGESVITAIKPNEAGTTTELLPEPNTDDNWQTVDEIPPSDTDYNYTTVADKKDTYVHESLPGAASVIKAVVTVARVARSGADITHAYLVTRTGTTDYEGSAQNVGTAVNIVTKLEELDPDTGLPWVVGDFNTSETGIRFDT